MDGFMAKPKMEGLFMIGGNPADKPKDIDWDNVDWQLKDESYIPWKQLTRLEAVKLHVRLIEEKIKGEFHHSYYWFENKEPVYMVDEIKVIK